MEMWISAYALTTGVKKIEGRRSVIDKDIFVSQGYGAAFTIGKDAHATEEAAKAAAETMRVKKIASLRKQIAKLEGLKF